MSNEYIETEDLLKLKVCKHLFNYIMNKDLKDIYEIKKAEYTFTQEEIDTLFEMLCRVKDKNANEYSVYYKVRKYFEEDK